VGRYSLLSTKGVFTKQN